MFKVEAVKKVTVTEQIMEQIANLITSRQLQPGEQLPNERDLAEQFGVTRGRVREALRALSLVGLISIKAGEGSFVNRHEVPIPAETIVWMFHNEIHNLDEVYAARKLIESEVYLTAAKNIAKEQIVKLEEAIETFNKAKNSITPVEFLKLLDQFDIYLGEICGNRIYAKLIQTVVHLRKETSLKLLAVPGAIGMSIKTRTALLKALKSGDLTKVQIAIDDFFISSKQFYDNITEE